MSCARDSGGDSWFYNHYDTVRRLLLQTFPTPKLTERPLTTKLFIYKLEIFSEIELKCLLFVNSLQEKNLNFWHNRRHILKVRTTKFRMDGAHYKMQGYANKTRPGLQ